MLSSSGPDQHIIKTRHLDSNISNAATVTVANGTSVVQTVEDSSPGEYGNRVLGLTDITVGWACWLEVQNRLFPAKPEEKPSLQRWLWRIIRVWAQRSKSVLQSYSMIRMMMSEKRKAHQKVTESRFQPREKRKCRTRGWKDKGSLVGRNSTSFSSVQNRSG